MLIKSKLQRNICICFESKIYKKVLFLHFCIFLYFNFLHFSFSFFTQNGICNVHTKREENQSLVIFNTFLIGTQYTIDFFNWCDQEQGGRMKGGAGGKLFLPHILNEFRILM